MAGECFIKLVLIILFWIFMLGKDMVVVPDPVGGISKMDDCDIKREIIIRTCPTWAACRSGMRMLRCRTDAVKIRLMTEEFHPYIAKLMSDNQDGEFFEIFGDSTDIAMMSLTNSLINGEGGALRFVKLVGNIENDSEAELVILKMPKRSGELIGSTFCDSYNSMIQRIKVPVEFMLWKKNITDRICTK